MGLFTKIVNEPQNRFKIYENKKYNEKGQVEEEFYSVSEYIITRHIRRINGAVKHRKDWWRRIDNYKWEGFKSETGPYRVSTGPIKFTLDEAKAYIEARENGGPINRIVATPVDTE